MAGRYPQPIVVDTTVLSNFASTDSISFLIAVLESPMVVPAVRDELKRGLDTGHDYLDTAVDALGDELPVRPLSSDRDFQHIRERLNLGEA
jgi:predicted nucleic acid-binding protein